MHSFRFNPVFEQWTLLGTPIIQPEKIQSAHFLPAGRQKDFRVASHPHQPFVLEPALQPSHPARLYAEQSPVGEYELLLYSGDRDLFEWDAQIWASWLATVQYRIVQLRHNPYLHHLSLFLSTHDRTGIEDLQRVGDLIATSHPLTGSHPELDMDLVQKILKKEEVYILAKDAHGLAYIPTAPLHEREVWYLPLSQKSGVEQITVAERKSAALALANCIHLLHQEYPTEHYVIRLYSHLIGGSSGALWWLQIHRQEPGLSALPIHHLPERLLKDLKLAAFS